MHEVSTLADIRRWPNLKPRDAATLILLDRSAPVPKVLLGKRHDGHVFLPGKHVFPGGRLEADDRRMPASGTLGPRVEAALRARTTRPPAGLGRALALAAARETYEETGLMPGRIQDAMPDGPSGGVWADFFARSVLPELAPFRLVGRAITPPRFARRFDTRFFSLDREAIAVELPGLVGPDKEFVEIAWVDLPAAQELDVPTITAVMLDELADRLASGFGPDLPVPFYRELHGRFVREEL
jgi:8-oxo-dGTP pyrophosphatase MutT (NUDIX family)